MLKVGAVRHTHHSMGPMLSLKTRADVFSWVCPVLPTDSRLMEVTERCSILQFLNLQFIVSYNWFNFIYILIFLFVTLLGQ